MLLSQLETIREDCSRAPGAKFCTSLGPFCQKLESAEREREILRVVRVRVYAAYRLLQKIMCSDFVSLLIGGSKKERGGNQSKNVNGLRFAKVKTGKQNYVMSPYPTVVMVTTAHQKASGIDLK
jgi:hypothetical protein